MIYNDIEQGRLLLMGSLPLLWSRIFNMSAAEK